MRDATDVLVAVIDRGRHLYRNYAIGCYLAAATVVAIVIAVSGREFYKQGPMVLVGFLVLVAGAFQLLYRSVAWERHPVLVALRTAPHEVERAAVLRESGFAALSNDRTVVIEARGREVMLTFHRRDLVLLRRTLEDACRNIQLNGFERDRS